jgi:hypothetical protein
MHGRDPAELIRVEVEGCSSDTRKVWRFTREQLDGDAGLLTLAALLAAADGDTNGSLWHEPW